MSRVYTEQILEQVCEGTAAYIWAFYRALGQTRIAFTELPSPSATLLDAFLNFFGATDPYSEEEVAITQSWSQWDVWHDVDSKLHKIPLRFKADWPPPQQWVTQIDWHPLPQNSPRHRHFGSFRTRKAGASSGE